MAVPRASLVRVTLSQPVGTGAGTLRAFSAQRGGQLAGTVATAGNVLTFSPAQRFQPGEVVSVSVPTTIQSSTGVPLAAAQVYQFTAAAAGGTGAFALASGLSTASFPHSMATGDVDGDGDLDVLSIGSSGVTISYNTGQGTFVTGPGAGAGIDPTGLAVADIDGDGDLDVLTSNGLNGNSNSPGTIQISLNNGQGVFSNGARLSVASMALGIAVGDVDGDGDQDIVFSGVFGSYARAGVCLNAGNGTFGAVQQSGTTNWQIGVSLADIDNDGDLDLLSASPGSVAICRNNGRGTFGAFYLAAAYHSKSLATVDVDGDGDLDLLTSDGSGLGVSLNDGQGNFVLGSSLSVPNSGNYSGLAVGDIDGDGDPDVAIGNGNYFGTISVRLNNGAGVFGGGYDPVVGGYLAMPSAAAFADVNGDGNLDLLVAKYNSGGGEVLLNQATPLISSIAPTSAPIGSTVMVTGNNLSGVTALTLNGVTVSSFVVVNAATITFVVPAGATSGPIAATTPLGTARSSPFTVTVVSNARFAANAFAVSAYPNPAREVLHFAINGLAVGQPAVHVELLDQLGQVVAQTSLQTANQQAEATLPVGELAAGLYVLRLRTGTHVVTRMICRE